jgi:basic amino acid/polyamine antiporter, APA family
MITPNDLASLSKNRPDLSFRPERRGLFFLVRWYERAALRSGGISLRLIAQASPLGFDIRQRRRSAFHFPAPPLSWPRFRKPRQTSLPTTPEAHTQSPAAKISGGKLLQVLGVWFGIAAAVGNTIAAGIVRTPGDIAKILPNAWLFLGVWVIGGLYALFGASSMAELGAAIPRSGGQYNFSRRAIGDYAGFIVGWSDWLSSCGTLAAVAIVIGEYSGKLIGILAGKEKIIAVAVIVGFGILQWRGVRWGSRAQLITAAMKTAAFVILVIACFILGGNAHRAASLATATATKLTLASGWPLAVALMLGLQAVFYTIDGWDGIIYFGEEVRDPGKDVPRAIFGSVFSIMAIYLLMNAAVLYVLPMDQIAGNNFSLGTAAERIFGRFGDPIIRTIMVVSLLSCINAVQLFCSRILYAMSADGLFFRSFARVNKGGTPELALLLSTIVGVLFVLGSFERVIAMLSFFFVANYTLTYTSLFVLRRKEPQMPRPYRAWGYPWTTAIALIGSILFLVGSIVTDRDNAPLALGMLVLSYPIYRILKWGAARTTQS